MITLQQIADALGTSTPSHGDREITGANGLAAASGSEISIISADRYAKQYAATSAGAVIAGRKIKFTPRDDVPTLMVDDPELAMVKTLEVLAPPVPHPQPGVHPTAIIAEDVVLGDGHAIGPFVTIGRGTRIGRNAKIHAAVHIGSDCVIGDDCTIFSTCVIRERITLGNRVLLHALVVIGTDGFGYRWDGRKHAKIPQIGTVVIEDDVEIGSGSCVDRAKFSETRIGRGTKIDNQVQIAHNVRIGQHAILCGQAGVAGSAIIGNGVVLGGAAVVRDHITIGDGAMAAGHAAMFEDVAAKTTVSGVPAMPHRQTLREQGSIRRLPEVITEFRKLQQEVKDLREQLAKIGT